VFGNLRESASAAQSALSETMMGAWTAFARDPTGSGPGWPRLGGSKDGKELGRFTGEGKLVVESPAFADRNCGLFKEYLDRRAAN
jgi:hypothetical protein